MKAVIYSPSEKIWGGGQIYIDQLCEYLNERGHDVRIATSEPDTFSSPTLRMRSVASRRNRLLHAFALARELHRGRVATVLLNDLSSLWLAPIFRLAGLRTCALLHLYLQPRDSSGLGHGRVECALLRQSAKACHAVLSVNRQNEAAFPVPVKFVGNYVPDWFFDAPSREPKNVDLLMVCRLAKEKDIPLALRLLKSLNARREVPLRLRIVGEGEEREGILSLVADLGLADVVEVLPWVARASLPQVYDAARCFLITSHHEGFATTLIEAHARGLPAIVTDTAGYCQEFVESHGGSTGLSFSAGHEESHEWLDATNRWLDECASLRQACIDKARVFCADNVLGKIESSMVPVE